MVRAHSRWLTSIVRGGRDRDENGTTAAPKVNLTCGGRVRAPQVSANMMKSRAALRPAGATQRLDLLPSST